MLLMIAGSSECASVNLRVAREKAVYNHWTGVSGLDWWTDIFVLKSIFMLSNETSAPCRLSHDAF